MRIKAQDQATPLAKGRRTVQLEVTVDVSSSHAEFKVLDNHCQFASDGRNTLALFVIPAAGQVYHVHGAERVIAGSNMYSLL